MGWSTVRESPPPNPNPNWEVAEPSPEKTVRPDEAIIRAETSWQEADPKAGQQQEGANGGGLPEAEALLDASRGLNERVAGELGIAASVPLVQSEEDSTLAAPSSLVVSPISPGQPVDNPPASLPTPSRSPPRLNPLFHRVRGSHPHHTEGLPNHVWPGIVTPSPARETRAQGQAVPAPGGGLLPPEILLKKPQRDKEGDQEAGLLSGADRQAFGLDLSALKRDEASPAGLPEAPLASKYLEPGSPSETPKPVLGGVDSSPTHSGLYRGAKARTILEPLHVAAELRNGKHARPEETVAECEGLCERIAAQKPGMHGWELTGHDAKVDRCVVWADNPSAQSRWDVAEVIRRLREGGATVFFFGASDEAAAKVVAGGVDMVVTNLGRSRPDSGLLFVERLQGLGYEGPCYVYSKSAMDDPSLKKECIQRGAKEVFGGPEEAIKVIMQTLRNPTFARWERPPALLKPIGDVQPPSKAAQVPSPKVWQVPAATTPVQVRRIREKVSPAGKK